MRAIPLTTAKGGLSRLRIKGGARADTLYDLKNGFVTDVGTIHSRPGTVRIGELDQSTKGLCSFQGKFHVFSDTVVDVPSEFVLHVLAYPDVTVDPLPTLAKIHFAAPFLGFLYVVAEFSDGSIYHYWLRTSGTWAANTVYFIGDVITPTDPNGLLYIATRVGSTNPVWAPNVPRSLNDVVEPTEYSGYYHTVVEVLGDNPRSGSVEPDWAENTGEQTIEDVDGIPNSVGVPATVPSENQTPQSVQDRYGL